MHHLQGVGPSPVWREPCRGIDIGVRIGGEIDAEEDHDEARAEQTDDGQRDRGGARGDAPRAEEPAQQLHQIDVLQEIGLIGEARHFLGQGRGAGGDAAGKLGDLKRERRPRRDDDQTEKYRDHEHHGGKHEHPRQLGEIGKRPACAIEHDGQQDAGKGEQDRGSRVPKADGDGKDADHHGSDFGGVRDLGSAEPQGLFGARP